MHKHELVATRGATELASEREKLKSISKELFELRGERDELRVQATNISNALRTARFQVEELEGEFAKAGEFYKGELGKAIDKRKAIEHKLEDARLEQESLGNLLDSAKSEHESVSKMLASAQNRLGHLDTLEQDVIRLEAENAELRHNASGAKQEIEVLRRDIAELDELKVQNKELAHCLQSMENSRKQYEADAKRYREQADKSEKQSETMRMKLDDVEQSFAEMAKKQDEALRVSRHEKVKKHSNGRKQKTDEVDDLTQIVGIGKVFEETLHTLGIRSFRQIAAFGPADIARVNMELKEFKGRMEQDDWVGQAKELYFKKYGNTDVH